MTTASAHPARNEVMTGILLMVLAVSLFPVSDALSKYLVGTYDVLQVVWIRYVVQFAAVLAVLAPRSRWHLMRTRRPGLQAVRGFFTALSTLAFVTALGFVPLVDAVTLLFSSSLMLVALSVPLLGERVGIHRWSAVIIGFIGVLVVMRPGMGVLHWAAAGALVSAFSNAIFQIATRALSVTDRAITTFFFVNVTGVVLLGPAMFFVWIPMPWDAWVWVTAAGLLSGAGHYLMIRSFDYAGASVLAPFNYAQIVIATLIGYFWFSEIPDLWTVVGLVVVVGSGLYILRREQRAARIAPEATS
jgi:drug/metabolite transporter (DMT)-like permease